MVKLGNMVIDTVSGFKGVAVIRSEYLQGCCRIGVQPKIKRDGSLPDLQHFDEPQLKVSQRNVARKPRNPGGPAYAEAPEKKVSKR